MKSILLGIFTLVVVSLQAQDYRLYWKYKDYDGAIPVTVPGFLVEAGSWFAPEKAQRQLIRKVNKVRVLVFSENQSPVTEKDMRRFDRRAKRRHLDDLLMVREGQTHVRIMARERRGIIRKAVVLIKSDEDFVLVGLRGRLDPTKLVNLNDLLGKKKLNMPKVPDIPKIPVSRV